jgi:DNA-binding CsgD family transcriptional regulator
MKIIPPSIPLTPRELQTLQLIVLGKTDHDIAIELNVTIHTINAYRKSLLHKLGANNVASLVRISIERKIIQLGHGA